MYAISMSLPVNPPNVLPTLTQEQVWQGLMLKAENAVPFVPIMESCRVLEKYADGLLREIVIAGNKIKEKISFTPTVEVCFERVETTDDAGWISNTISESENGLMLTFTFAVNFKGVEPGSEEEQAEAEKMKKTYKGAIENTLKKIREYVSQEKI